jgi:hypothetical protein
MSARRRFFWVRKLRSPVDFGLATVQCTSTVGGSQAPRAEPLRVEASGFCRLPGVSRAVGRPVSPFPSGDVTLSAGPSEPLGRVPPSFFKSRGRAPVSAETPLVFAQFKQAVGRRGRLSPSAFRLTYQPGGPIRPNLSSNCQGRLLWTCCGSTGCRPIALPDRERALVTIQQDRSRLVGSKSRFIPLVLLCSWLRRGGRATKRSQPAKSADFRLRKHDGFGCPSYFGGCIGEAAILVRNYWEKRR